MELRGARKSDVRAIMGMIKQGTEEKTLAPRKKKEVRRHIGGFVVAEHEGSLVGMASIVVYDRRLAEVRSVYVDPLHRGNGIAKELVRRVQEQTVHDLPSSTLIAITQTPSLFASDGFSHQQGRRQIMFKNM